MIGQKGIPAHSGGVERHVEEIGQRLVNKGHYVTVYCRKHYIGDVTKEYKGMELKVVPTINTSSLDAITYTALATFDAMKGKHDIIHYHALGPASLSFIPSISGKKVVVTVHGLDWQRAKWGNFAKAYLKLGERVAGNYPDKCILVSESLLKYFVKKYGNKEQFVVIPNGVTIQESQEPFKILELDLKKDSYILFLARLVPEKGCHYLIEAYKRLTTNKKLVIAGASSHTDTYVNSLKTLAKDDQRIIFTGAVGGRLLNELYSHAFLYVLPSQIEGMPLTLLESMSYGTMPIVSNIPENIEVIKDEYGIAFDNNSSHSLISAIMKCLNNPQYVQETARKCKDYVEAEFTWDKTTSQIESVYKHVIRN